MYVFGCRLSLFRLCVSDSGITPVDDITNGITWAVFCLHISHISFASSWYLFCLSVIVLAFGEIMCIRDSYVYQKCVLYFLIDECYIRSVKRNCFVRKYAVVPVQLEIVILQYIGWCLLVTRDFFFNQFSYFCQFLRDNFG